MNKEMKQKLLSVFREMLPGARPGAKRPCGSTAPGVALGPRESPPGSPRSCPCLSIKQSTHQGASVLQRSQCARQTWLMYCCRRLAEGGRRHSANPK